MAKTVKKAVDDKPAPKPRAGRAIAKSEGRINANPAAPITGGAAIETVERLNMILHYRKMGASLQQIADKFDLTVGRISVIITEAMASLPLRNIEEIRNLELERLDAMQFSVWGAAQKGDVGAISMILSIMNRRARYLGLDVTEAIDPTQGKAAEALKAADVRNALLSRLRMIKERRDTPKPLPEREVITDAVFVQVGKDVKVAPEQAAKPRVVSPPKQSVKIK